MAAYAAISLLFLGLPAAPWVLGVKRVAAYLSSPGQESASAALEAVSALPSRWKGLVSADVENRELKARLEELNVLETERQALERENKALREALSLKTRAGWKWKAARVTGRDPSTWYSALHLDKGASHGIKEGAPVFALTEERLALVGRVAEADAETSRVLLLTDELASVAAQVSPGGWEGLVEGQGKRRLVMNYIPSDALARPGDEVLTSPVSGSYPQGVLVGRVLNLRDSDPYLAYRSAEVEAAVDPTRLTLVLVKEQP